MVALGFQVQFVEALLSKKIRFAVATTSSGRTVGNLRNGKDYQLMYDNDGAAWSEALACLLPNHVGVHSVLVYCAKLMTRSLYQCLHPETRACHWLDLQLSFFVLGTSFRVAFDDNALKPGTFSLFHHFPPAVRRMREIELSMGLEKNSQGTRDHLCENPFEARHIDTAKDLLGGTRGGGRPAITAGVAAFGPTLAAAVGSSGTSVSGQFSMLSQCLNEAPRDFKDTFAGPTSVVDKVRRSATRRIGYGQVRQAVDQVNGPLGYLLRHPELEAPQPSPATPEASAQKSLNINHLNTARARARAHGALAPLGRRRGDVCTQCRDQTYFELTGDFDLVSEPIVFVSIRTSCEPTLKG